MNEAAGLTLAVILGLTARFQAGIEAMKAGDPAKAAAEMTAVIKAEPGLPDLASGARLLRGQALKAQSKVPEALEDFRWLATHDVAPDVRKKAREEFAAAGGKPESLAPELPPLAEWKRMQAAIAGDEGRRVTDWLSPAFRKQLAAMGEMMGESEPLDIGIWFAEDDALLTGQAMDEAVGTAALTFREDSQVIQVEWVQDGPRWRINRLRQELEEEDAAPGVAILDGPMAVDGERGGDRPSGGKGPAAAESGDLAAGADPAPELKAEVEGCIAKLGSADGAIRAQARARLKAIGEAARPLLKKHASDPDPEVATSVRELLARP